MVYGKESRKRTAQINASDKLRQARGSGRRDDYDYDGDEGSDAKRRAKASKNIRERVNSNEALWRTNGHLADFWTSFDAERGTENRADGNVNY